jgi:hypothetical protein
VGQVHGDGTRPAIGSISLYNSNVVRWMNCSATGVFATKTSDAGPVYATNPSLTGNISGFDIDLSRVGPTANKVQGRAWGSLACVYLGLPAS